MQIKEIIEKGIDKQIMCYIDRASKMSRHSGNIIEIAKMIQQEEHREEHRNLFKDLKHSEG